METVKRRKCFRFFLGMSVALLIVFLTVAPILGFLNRQQHTTYEQVFTPTKKEPTEQEKVITGCFLLCFLEIDAFFGVCGLCSKKRKVVDTVFCGITFGIDAAAVVTSVVIFWDRMTSLRMEAILRVFREIEPSGIPHEITVILPVAVGAVLLVRAAQGIVWVLLSLREKRREEA